MKKIKSLLFITICIVSLVLTSCAKNKIDDKKIIVGASANPHAKILEEARSYIESKGYELEIKIYDDYVVPNIALEDGELDANFFQHKPYLDNFNKQNNTHLVSVLQVHYEPLGIYAGKASSLDNLQNGAKVAIPNDTTNRARALLLLAAKGLISVNESKGLEIDINDITSNPLNLEIIPFEAASIPAQLSEVEIAVINGNYAESAKIAHDKLLAQEDKESVAATTYGNIIAVKEGNEEAEAIKVLIEALSQDSIRQYINDNYQGTVIPF